MRRFVLNGACVGVEKGNFVAVFETEKGILAEHFIEGRTGSHLFPAVSAALLKKTSPGSPQQIDIVRGPGSFPGLRASLALAKGLAMGWQCPLRGVTLGDALRQTIAAPQAVIITLARRGYVFVDFPQKPIQSFLIEEALSLLTSDITIIAGDALSGEQKILPLVEKCLALGIEISPTSYPSAMGVIKASDALPKEALENWLPLYIDSPKISRPKVANRPKPLEGQ